MNDPATFYLVSLVLWLVLAAIWKRSDLLNSLIKIAMFFMAAWSGFFVYAAALGVTP